MPACRLHSSRSVPNTVFAVSLNSALSAFVVAAVLNLLVTDLHSAIVVRTLSGMAAAPLSTLGFLYMLEPFPRKEARLGISLALMCTLFASPVARIVSPSLLQFGGYEALYMFEMGLALIALPIIYLLPLTAPPRANVIQLHDILSYLLLAVGFGCLAVVLTLGRLYWWFEAPWIGVLLAISVGSHRFDARDRIAAQQSPDRFPLAVFGRKYAHGGRPAALPFRVFRAIILRSQLLPAAGVVERPDRQRFIVIILLASLAGGLFCAFLMTTRYVETAHVLALALIAGGAFLDSQSTSLTRPPQMYLSQAMVAAGAAMFLPPVMANGFKAAISRGVPYIVNFLVIFVFTQSIGSLFASAMLGTFVTIREKFHSNVLVEHILLQDPIVAQRISQLSAAYGKVLGDKMLLNAEGLVLLAQQVSREAYILAYNDTFLVIGYASVFGLIVILLHQAWRRLAWPRTSQPDATPAQS